MLEPPRLLHRDSSRGYTTSVYEAMFREPPSISAEDLDLVTRQAQDRELRAWRTTRRRMLDELEHLRAHVHSPHVARAARALERELAALDRKLTR